MRNSPIGIFDSGIGGLTVAHALKEKLPNESIIYFGDTEHLPYGEKSDEAIQNFSKNIAEFLERKNCKARSYVNTLDHLVYNNICSFEMSKIMKKDISRNST